MDKKGERVTKQFLAALKKDLTSTLKAADQPPEKQGEKPTFPPPPPIDPKYAPRSSLYKKEAADPKPTITRNQIAKPTDSLFPRQQPKFEVNKVETSKYQPSKYQPTKYQPKYQPAKQSKFQPAKFESKNQSKLTKYEPNKYEPNKYQPTKYEPSKYEPKFEQSKHQTSKFQTIKPEQPRTQKHEPSKYQPRSRPLVTGRESTRGDTFGGSREQQRRPLTPSQEDEPRKSQSFSQPGMQTQGPMPMYMMPLPQHMQQAPQLMQPQHMQPQHMQPQHMPQQMQLYQQTSPQTSSQQLQWGFGMMPMYSPECYFQGKEQFQPSYYPQVYWPRPDQGSQQSIRNSYFQDQKKGENEYFGQPYQYESPPEPLYDSPHGKDFKQHGMQRQTLQSPISPKHSYGIKSPPIVQGNRQSTPHRFQRGHHLYGSKENHAFNKSKEGHFRPMTPEPPEKPRLPSPMHQSAKCACRGRGCSFCNSGAKTFRERSIISLGSRPGWNGPESRKPDYKKPWAEARYERRAVEPRGGREMQFREEPWLYGSGARKGGY